MENNFDKEHPCKDCQERYLCCWDKCKKYKIAKNILQRRKYKNLMEKKIENDFWATIQPIRKRRRY